MPIDISLTSDLTFSHEIGHLLGAKHDRVSTRQLCGGAHYLRDQNLKTAIKNAGPSIARIPYYSDPLIDYNGEPTGLNTDDKILNNASEVRGNGAEVESFRQESSSIIITPINCDLELFASVNSSNSSYEYFWRWSYSKIFIPSNPGNVLGYGNSVLVEEPVKDNCETYYIELTVSLGGKLISKSIKRQGGGVCSDNVLPCWQLPTGFVLNHDKNEILIPYGKSDIENQSVEMTDDKKNIEVFSISGGSIGRIMDIKQITTLGLMTGVYILHKQDNNGVSVRKIFYNEN